MTLVEPGLLQPGDQVVVGKDCARIRAIDGPDLVGAFDVYLDNDSHAVISEPVQVLIG